MTNLDSILKSRNITLPTKVLIVRAMVFPVVMYDVRINYQGDGRVGMVVQGSDMIINKVCIL